LAFGKEITVECFEELLSTIENNSCLKEAVFKLNNLNTSGKDNRATALSVVMLLRLSLLPDQNLSVCENPKVVINANTNVRSKTLFIVFKFSLKKYLFFCKAGL
jgi:hypothetical protein